MEELTTANGLPEGRCPCGRLTTGRRSATCGENDHLFWPASAEPLFRLPAEWERIDNVLVHDPDGWRGPKGKDWNVPITRAEWDVRLVTSTVEDLSHRMADGS